MSKRRSKALAGNPTRCRPGAKKIEVAVEVKEKKSKTKKERLCGEESLKILE